MLDDPLAVAASPGPECARGRESSEGWRVPCSSRGRKMMIKVEEDPAVAMELLPAPTELTSPVDDDDDEDEEDTDSDGDAAARRRRGTPPLKKGPWTPAEDKRLMDYVQAHGEGNWNQVRINAGLNRCGKSCRLRWSNHLRPDLKKGPFDDEEVEKILRMHMAWGNKWAKMAALLPGRTDNEIKNYWNTRLKRHQRAGFPIYPEYLVSQASNQDMDFGTPEDSRGTKQPDEFSQNVLGISNLFGDYFDSRAFTKHVSVPNLPCPNLVDPNSLSMDAMNPLQLPKSSGCVASDYNGSLSFVQIHDESEKAGCSTGFCYEMTDNQLAPLGNAIVSGHPVFDGNLSTSWTTKRSTKMELPSVQDTRLPSVQNSNYGLSDAWACDYPSGSIEQADTLVESPGSLKSESISSQNTGLDPIVYKGDGVVDPMESQGVFEVPVPLFSCNQVLQSNMCSMWHSVPRDDEIESYPLNEIQASKTPLGSDALLAESKCYPETSLTGKHFSSWEDIRTLDASLEAGLLSNGPLFSKDHSISIYNSLIDGDSCEETKLATAVHGLDTFPWNSTPGACNMSDFSNL